MIAVSVLASSELPRAVAGRGPLPGLLPAVSAPDVSRNNLGMRFVAIPGGAFDMGSTIGPGEAPVHRVTVPAFWMGATEVTQAQWQAVTGSNPSHFKQAGPTRPSRWSAGTTRRRSSPG